MESPAPSTVRPSKLRNWLSLTGLVVVALFCSFVLFLLGVLAMRWNVVMGDSPSPRACAG